MGEIPYFTQKRTVSGPRLPLILICPKAQRANTLPVFVAIFLFTRHERFDHLKGKAQRPFHHC